MFHIYNRAVDRHWIFSQEEDKEYFLSLLIRFVTPYPITIYHWLIMSNHFHIAAETLDINQRARRKRTGYDTEKNRLLRRSRILLGRHETARQRRECSPEHGNRRGIKPTGGIKIV